MNPPRELFPPPLHPWDEAAARASLERWEALCKRVGWNKTLAERGLLEALFGASWYCTRFLFYRGLEGVRCLHEAPPGPRAKAEKGADPEEDLEKLRIQHNESLLRWLSADLRNELTREQLGKGLAELAVNTLRLLLHGGAEETWRHFMVLGLGRLAGEEMNYGSDLDLIFLYPKDMPGTQVSREVTLLLRRCAAISPSGRLYEIDIRLRPHGSAGTLVTSLEGFEAYHRATRETWEKQVLCRCQPLHDPEGHATRLLQRLREHLYTTVPSSRQLRGDILGMRARVERELGHPAGKYDLKRGPGGLMDIDFISHYLQLTHGAKFPPLRQGGTRHCLRIASEQGLLDKPTTTHLLNAYDALKRIEASLRLPDMRAVSSFSARPENLRAIARAAGHPDGSAFLHAYQQLTAEVREQYHRLLD